jgi:proteasome lid subunit RPN8/RPN11
VSGDEIVFGEVRFREPVRMRRPDRDPRRACVAYGIPREGELPVFLDRRPADSIERHALSDTSVELGGILLGKECVDDETGQPFVWITEAIEARHYENTQASFTYTHDSWEVITRERDRRFPDLDIVGWYHTHPDFGIFLSSHDLFIHQNFFSQPLQVAYVVDPIRQTRGFFQWHNGQMAALRGFYLSADRGERQALARLANDLENIPNGEGGGGAGISPRLEAELLAMVTRPQVTSVVDRGSLATALGLLGLVVGSLATAILFWLSGLNQTLQSQSELLQSLATAQQEASRSPGDERISVKEQALDTLLADLRVGSTPESIRARYSETLEQNEAMRRRLEVADIEKTALAEHVASLQRETASLGSTLAALKAREGEQEKNLRHDLEEKESQVLQLRNELTAKDLLIKDGETGSLANRFNLALWAAIGGWGAFALALAGFLTLLSRRSQEESSPMMPGSVEIPRRGTIAATDVVPPHVIE